MGAQRSQRTWVLLQGGAISYAAAVASAYRVKACIVTGALLALGGILISCGAFYCALTWCSLPAHECFVSCWSSAVNIASVYPLTKSPIWRWLLQRLGLTPTCPSSKAMNCMWSPHSAPSLLSTPTPGGVSFFAVVSDAWLVLSNCVARCPSAQVRSQLRFHHPQCSRRWWHCSLLSVGLSYHTRLGAW